jgi:hypothetical protein
MSPGYPIVAFPGLGVDPVVRDAQWYNFTPQVKIVGTGTVPNYVTNSGRFMVANNVVRCDILLDGDGGIPGSGTGILNVTLPATPSPARLGGFIQVGNYTNNANSNLLMGSLTAGSPWMALSYLNTTSGGSPNIVNFTGAQQDNAARTIRLHFWYECDLLAP